MPNDLKKISARVYLDENDVIIQKVTYIYAAGTESEPLSRFIHLGVTTDSILFGDECDIRFIVRPNLLQLYDTDVDCLEFINDSNHTVTVSCFGQKITLAPKEMKNLVDNSSKKFTRLQNQQ